jgi:glucose/arabinose dehydrogenase
MRSITIVLAALLTACTGGQELATTTSADAATTTFPATTTPTTIAEPESTTSSSGEAATTTTTTLPELQSLAYEKVADLPFPVEMTALPGAPLSYIATKDGRVWVYDGAKVLEDPALDISGQVRNSGEQGLLSIALHPNDPSRFFAHYSAGDGDTVVSEFGFTSDSDIDPGTERVLLRLNQPAGNHNGGMITFGPGDLLFLGLGDGGSANDRFGNGQNTDTLLGGLVTLQVDGDPNPTLFDYGLRNPWRFWFDDGLMYVADVGQNSFEEVNVAPIEAGINFGWPITEGLHCFRPPTGCDTSGLTLPVIEVAHGDAGTCSITGGVVYRGRAIPEIDGHYFYSDYCGGYLRSFRYDGSGTIDQVDWTEQVGAARAIPGFGVDGEGEMYVATTEELFKVVPVRR